jgi:hypothetical protein
MSAFNFRFCNNSKWILKNGTKGHYNNGKFNIGGWIIKITKNFYNESEGIGRFVGPDHEYFVYCGRKIAGIGVAKFNSRTNQWKHYNRLEWNNIDTGDNGRYLNKIWFVKEEVALIFESKDEFRSGPMKREYLGGKKGGKESGIKLNLKTGEFTAVSETDIKEQRHSVVTENSKWPFPSSKNCLCEGKLLQSTLMKVEGLIMVQQISLESSLSKMKAEVNACLRQTYQDLGIFLDDVGS